MAYIQNKDAYNHILGFKHFYQKKCNAQIQVKFAYLMAFRMSRSGCWIVRLQSNNCHPHISGSTTGIPGNFAAGSRHSTGIMLNLTAKQLESLQLLREQTEYLTADRRNSDSFLIKWLVARDFDVAKAEQMIRNVRPADLKSDNLTQRMQNSLPKSIEWRRNNDMADILNWEPPEVLKLYYPVGIVGADNDGCPVLIVPFGLCDINGILKAVGTENFVRYTLQILENCAHQAKKTGQIVVLFDMKGLSLRNVLRKTVIDAALEIVRDFENNYPEMLKVAYVVNAPMAFKIIFDLIKPLLTMRTMKKIEIFGSNPQLWQEAILTNVPSDQLPVRWGGTKSGTDEFCSPEVCMGGPVPAKYFQAHNDSV